MEGIDMNHKHMDICQCPRCMTDKEHGKKRCWVVVAIIIGAALMLLGPCKPAWSAELIAGYTLDQWASAIRLAEGNDNYGILSVKCKKGQECRQICKNTVFANFKRWKWSGQNVTYVRFLQRRYAPFNVSNDPHHLNEAWEKNVRYFLAKGKNKRLDIIKNKQEALQ